ncbi:MAG: hypothetical protein ACYDBH_00445 [Acidobacteriaceae bacterium]
MKKLLFAALLSVSIIAFGASDHVTLISPDGHNTLRIYKAPCSDPQTLKVIKNIIKPRWATGFHKAEGVFWKNKYHACWRPVPDGILVVAEDGSHAVIKPSVMSAPRGKTRTRGAWL